MRVYVDANVLVTAAFSGDPYSASRVLFMSENIGPLELFCAQTSVDEGIRNIKEKVPEAVDDLHAIIDYGMTVVEDPSRERERELLDFADQKDAIHLAAAIDNNCGYLATYNTDDFYAEDLDEIEVVEPGKIVASMREVFTSVVFSQGWVRML